MEFNLQENNSAGNFYDNSYYQNKILNVEDNLEINNNQKNSNKNLIILYNEPKKRIKSIIENIENNIENWKKELLNEFEKFNTNFEILKDYISELNEISENSSFLSTNLNNNNPLKDNFNLDKIEENQEKVNKTIKHNQHNNNLFRKNYEKIDLIYKKLKEFDLNEINFQFNSQIKGNIKIIESLIFLNFTE